MNGEEAIQKNQEGSKLFLEGKYEEALRLFNEALEIDAEYLGALYKRSDVYRKLGREAEADTDMERWEALRQAPAEETPQRWKAMSTRKRVKQHLEFPRGFGGKTIIDKSSQSVTVLDRFLFWTVRQRSIPFSAVMGVMMDEKHHLGSKNELPYEAYEISIEYDGKMLKIIEGRDSNSILESAEEISLLMEKKLKRSYIDGSG